MKNSAIRIIILVISVYPLTLPYKFINLNVINSPIFLMFLNIIIPMTIVSFIIIGGPYD